MMNRFKWLLKMLMIFSMISVSYNSLATSTKKLSLSLEWSETEHALYRQNCALKSLQSCTLTLVAGSNTPVFLTITNNSTRTTAVNIRAILPPALADIVQDSANCAQLLPSQQCQIAFTPGNAVHSATTVPVRGDNTMSYDVTIQVVAGSFTVGGTITGLSAQGLVLQNNGGDNLLVPINSTTFQFATPILAGSSYNVTVLTQPSGLSCSVTNGVGTNVMSNITNISIACSPAGGFAYVPNYGSNTVSRCFIEANGLFSTTTPCSNVLFPGQIMPSDVAINPARTMAYTVSSSTNKIVVNCIINTTSGVWSSCQTSVLSFIPKVIAFNPSGSRAYVTGPNAVYLCDVRSDNGKLENCNLTGPAPATITILSSIALNQAGTKAYLTDSFSMYNRVYTCDVNVLTGEIASSCVITSGFFNSPEGVTLSPNGSYLYVTNNNVGLNSKSVSICTVNSITGALSDCGILGFTVDFFSGVGKVAFNAAGTKAYLPYALSNPPTNIVNVCDADPVMGGLSNCVNSQGTGFSGPAGLAIY